MAKVCVSFLLLSLTTFVIASSVCHLRWIDLHGFHEAILREFVFAKTNIGHGMDLFPVCRPVPDCMWIIGVCSHLDDIIEERTSLVTCLLLRRLPQIGQHKTMLGSALHK